MIKKLRTISAVLISCFLFTAASGDVALAKNDQIARLSGVEIFPPYSEAYKIDGDQVERIESPELENMMSEATLKETLKILVSKGYSIKKIDKEIGFDVHFYEEIKKTILAIPEDDRYAAHKYKIPITKAQSADASFALFIRVRGAYTRSIDNPVEIASKIGLTVAANVILSTALNSYARVSALIDWHFGPGIVVQFFAFDPQSGNILWYKKENLLREPNNSVMIRKVVSQALKSFPQRKSKT